MSLPVEQLYRRLFADDAQARNGIWRELAAWLARFFPPDADILDLAAGYCEFINHAPTAGRRIAYDLNPDTAKRAAAGVETVIGNAAELARKIPRESLDAVFVSNFFEHLASPDELLALLGDIHTVLRPGGRLVVLQPNVKLAGWKYFDPVDHRLPLTDATLVEAAALREFVPVRVIRRFMPWSASRGRLPRHPLLVRLYLRLLPVSGWALGQQSLLVFQRG